MRKNFIKRYDRLRRLRIKRNIQKALRFFENIKGAL